MTNPETENLSIECADGITRTTELSPAEEMLVQILPYEQLVLEGLETIAKEKLQNIDSER